MGLKQIFFLLFYGLLMLLSTSCNEPVAVEQPPVRQIDEEDKISANKEIVRQEHDRIMLLARRYNWNLTQSESGLFYEILNEKSGNSPQSKDKVQIKGKIYLQDGTEIYSDQANGVKELIVNRSEDIVGLHELVKLMHEGEKSRAVIPSYLAYGISGDGDLIPPAAFLLCEIELVKIN